MSNQKPTALFTIVRDRDQKYVVLLAHDRALTSYRGYITRLRLK